MIPASEAALNAGIPRSVAIPGSPATSSVAFAEEGSESRSGIRESRGPIAVPRGTRVLFFRIPLSKNGDHP